MLQICEHLWTEPEDRSDKRQWKIPHASTCTAVSIFAIKYLYLRSSLSVGRCHASWTNWALKMEQVSSSETSVTADWHGVIPEDLNLPDFLHVTTLQGAQSVKSCGWCSADLLCVTAGQWKSCRFEGLKVVLMTRPVTPNRLAQLPTFQRRVQPPSSGQTEKSKSARETAYIRRDEQAKRVKERADGNTDAA
jgi:hypothetical protein